MVGEGARVGPRPEQAVQGARGAHARGQLAQRQLGADAVGQLAQRLVDRLLQARGRLAGGRGQGHALACGVRRGREQERQQARHRIGLAGAGAARDDRDRTAQGHGAGQLLPIGLPGARRRHEQFVEPGAHQARVHRVGRLGAFAHGARDLGLVAPIAAQVQALAVQHQRLVVVELLAHPHLLAAGQQLPPARHAARQRRRGRRQLRPLLLAPAQQGRRAGGQVGQLDAAVAMALELGQDRRRQHQRRRCGAQLGDEAREGARQAAQLAGLGQIADLMPQGVDLRFSLAHAFPCPAIVPVRPAVPGRAPARSSRACPGWRSRAGT